MTMRHLMIPLAFLALVAFVFWYVFVMEILERAGWFKRLGEMLDSLVERAAKRIQVKDQQ
jgi:hypothetical protein